MAITIQNRALAGADGECPPELELARVLYDSGDFGACLVEVEPFTRPPAGKAVRCEALLRKARCLSELGKFRDSLNTLEKILPFIDDQPARFKSYFHHQRARNRKKLLKTDDALLDYEAARFWAEESGEDPLSEAAIRNNIAKIYSEQGRFDEAVAESDRAIQIALRLREQIYLGSFYDQRAQVLLDRKDFSGAITFSKRALTLLDGHPSIVEARNTHGKALIGLGVSFLETDDPLESLRARRKAAKLIQVTPGTAEIELALTQSGGRVSQAADLLGMRHFALQRFIKSRKIERGAVRRRGRPVIQK